MLGADSTRETELEREVATARALGRTLAEFRALPLDERLVQTEYDHLQALKDADVAKRRRDAEQQAAEDRERSERLRATAPGVVGPLARSARGDRGRRPR